MRRRYLARCEYTEVVRGESRAFSHESAVEAADDAEAHALALDLFAGLTGNSGVGWARELKSCTVAPAKEGALPRGGRRVDGDRELEA